MNSMRKHSHVRDSDALYSVDEVEQYSIIVMMRWDIVVRKRAGRREDGDMVQLCVRVQRRKNSCDGGKTSTTNAFGRVQYNVIAI